MEGIEGMQTFGIMNALKTGNIVIDMMIAMIIPVVIGSLLSSLTYIKKIILETNWKNIFSKKKKLYERFITHSTMTSVYSTTDLGPGDSQNEVLIKAIQLYLDHHDLLKLRCADLDLRQFDNDDSNNNGYYYYYDSEPNTTTLADTLSKYKIVKNPLKNIWLHVGKYPGIDTSDDSEEMKSSKDEIQKEKEYDVHLIVTENKENIDNKEEGSSSSLKHRHEIKLQFISEGKDSIDIFIEKAYKWYISQLRTLEDDSRYLYELCNSKSSEEDSDNSKRKYKRYQLSDEKTFESLFFKEKETILKVVNHFTNKTGKYQIKGYPNKLGLLLHGPPGTGKTSLIKALAHLTGRSIVNVPLARISTNAELASIFFDQKYYIEGERVPVKLHFRDIIFVMEDVDAVSKVVRRRDGKTTAETTYTEQVEMPLTKSIWKLLMESDEENCKELVEMLIKKSERLKIAAKNPALLTSTVRQMASIPGLMVIGENIDDEITSKVAQEAVQNAQKVMSDHRTVGEFIGNHAKFLKRMIESGVTIDEDFENELLGISMGDSMSSGSFVSLMKPSLTRNVSYKKQYGGDRILVDNEPVHNTSCSNDVAAAIEALNYDDDAKVEMFGEGKMVGIGPSNASSAWKAKKDELNLSGLLNVLDGVVDTPGRMLVMTSNHPEILDPALIRPGRIDKKLYLGHLRYEDLVCMIEHYFQMKLDGDQVDRLKLAVEEPPSLKLTPAQVEQMACEFEDVDQMIEAIESKKHSLKPTAKNDRSVNGVDIAFS